MTDRITTRRSSAASPALRPATHEVIRANVIARRLYSGRSKSTDRAIAFDRGQNSFASATATDNQIFLELRLDRLDGLSQRHLDLATRGGAVGNSGLDPGLERVRMVRPGYAHRYDHVDPRELDLTLQPKRHGSVFLAGQIKRHPHGYEEAAAQGPCSRP